MRPNCDLDCASFRNEPVETPRASQQKEASVLEPYVPPTTHPVMTQVCVQLDLSYDLRGGTRDRGDRRRDGGSGGRRDERDGRLERGRRRERGGRGERSRHGGGGRASGDYYCEMINVYKHC